jgi:uncharacterized membrane protein
MTFMENETLQNAFLEALRSPQSYRNLAYLLLSFPTGLAYFILMVIGASVGTSLVVIGVGVLILWLTFGLLLLGGRFERWIANGLLKTQIAEPALGAFSFDALGQRESWKTILFLFLKFPLGIISFAISTSTVSFVLGLILAPFFYQYEFLQIGGRSIDSLWEALGASLFGLVLLPIALMFLNRIAGIWRKMSRFFLDDEREVKRKRLQEREKLEAEIIRRLVDEGRLDEDSMIEYREKRKNELMEY